MALKEWGVACSALGSGDQTVLLRKGGIREPAFVPQSSAFLLFPTRFHAQGALLKPGVAERYTVHMDEDPRQLVLTTLAVVTGAWTTPDPSVLAATDPLHVWGPDFLQARLKWRQAQPITLLELRCYRLATPLAVPMLDAYSGCFSWLDLSQAAAAADSGACGAEELLRTPGALQPAMDGEAFARRQAQLRTALLAVSSLQQLELCLHV